VSPGKIALGIVALLVLILFVVPFVSSFHQRMVQSWGGSMTVDLAPGRHLVNVTWQDHHLWYLTRNRHPDEKPETYSLHEKSANGLLEGTVIFVEK
jgi:hypothetical protein